MYKKRFYVGHAFKRAAFALCACVISLSVSPYAGAQTSAPASDTISLRYATIVHGYHVIDTTASYILQPWGYGATANLSTVGLASWFLTVNLTATVEGRFVGEKTSPVVYDSHGYSRGHNRHVHLVFEHDGPHITAQTPKDDDREPLPSEPLHASMDILSALGSLLHRLETRQSCDVSGSVFDGLRLMQIDAHGPRNDTVPEERDPYYTGSLMRCDFTGRQIGGFVQGSSHKAIQASPHPGAAWFKKIDDGHIIPVRIEFSHPKLGQLILVLQSPPRITHGNDVKPLPKQMP